MSGTCKECQHWAMRPDGFLWDDKNQKPGLWSECNRSKLPGSLLSLTDRYESVQTHEDFGCVMFEAKG